MTFFAYEYGNSMAIAILFAVFGSVIKNLLGNPKTDIK